MVPPLNFFKAMSVLLKLQNFAAANGVKLSTGESKWETISTGVTIEIGANASVIDGQFGKQLFIREGDMVAYIKLGANASALQSSYDISFFKHKTDASRNCFRAV
jgi:hypothetical protein